MKFPGSKLLYELDLSARSVSLDDLLRSCQQVGLTGFAELKTKDAVGMIFYYLGSAANALLRDGTTTYNGPEALDQLRLKVAAGEGMFAVYELPLDMAHLLRGITNRRKLPDTLAGKADLDKLIERMEIIQHTGTLEIQTPRGTAMLLFVRGRASNVYWETSEGLTFEKGEARHQLEAALGQRSGSGVVIQSEFSQVVWRDRYEVDSQVREKLELVEPPATAEVAAEEMATRKEILEELQRQVPSLIQALIFDVMTGAVLERRVRGADALRVALLAERIPSFTVYLKELVAAAHDDEVEVVELATARVALLVAIVPEAQEAIAVLADRSQPTVQMSAALNRMARAYAARLHPARGGAAIS